MRFLDCTEVANQSPSASLRGNSQYVREEEAAFLEERNDALGKGTAWQRVAELCELQDSRSKTNTRATRDVSRMKELFLALKREGDTAPGGQWAR